MRIVSPTVRTHEGMLMKRHAEQLPHSELMAVLQHHQHFASHLAVAARFVDSAVYLSLIHI